MTGTDLSGGASRLIPPALRDYQRSSLRTDIVAGLTLAAVAPATAADQVDVS